MCDTLVLVWLATMWISKTHPGVEANPPVALPTRLPLHFKECDRILDLHIAHSAKAWFFLALEDTWKVWGCVEREEQKEVRTLLKLYYVRSYTLRKSVKQRNAFSSEKHFSGVSWTQNNNSLICLQELTLFLCWNWLQHIFEIIFEMKIFQPFSCFFCFLKLWELWISASSTDAANFNMWKLTFAKEWIWNFSFQGKSDIPWIKTWFPIL